MWVCLAQEMVPAGEMTGKPSTVKEVGWGVVKNEGEYFWQSQSIVTVVTPCSRWSISYKDLGDISV